MHDPAPRPSEGSDVRGRGFDARARVRHRARFGPANQRAPRSLTLACRTLPPTRRCLGRSTEELAVGEGGFSVAVENPPPAKNCLARQLRTSTTDMRLSKMPVDSATSAAMTATVMTARITPYSAMV